MIKKNIIKISNKKGGKGGLVDDIEIKIKLSISDQHLMSILMCVCVLSLKIVVFKYSNTKHLNSFKILH